MNPDSNFLALVETLAPAARQKIESACVHVPLTPGQVVYRQGDAADAVYVVAAGVVEAVTYSPDGKLSRKVAEMPAGELFGDLAIFTDNPRLAAVRTQQAGEVLRIGKDDFLALMATIPEVGLFISRILARRLHGTSTEAHHSVYAIDLMGNLQRFDLLTIVQAISGMGHTGELRLNNSANEILGSFFFRKGRVEHARFGHLLGLEAIWQGFIESASEGMFSFRSMTQPSLAFPEENKIDMESTSLLLEGVGKRDNFQGMPEPLRKLEGHLARLTETLEWTNDENRIAAGVIWNAISAQQKPIRSIWLGLNFSAITFLEVVMEMGLNGQAELFIEEKA